MRGIIYKYTSPSGKIYIGQTVNERKRRNRFLNLNDSYGGPKIDRARRKYLPENFIYEVIFEIEADNIKDILNEKEIYYINQYDSVESGYNCDAGGNSRIGYVPTDEARLNMSKAQLGRKQSEETKRKLSEQRKGIAPLAAIESHQKEIEVFTKDGVFVGCYKSSVEAAKDLGIKGTANISAVLHNKRKSTGGYVFKFK